jgi:hypothetical protein
MILNKKKLVLAIGLVVLFPFSASADRVITGNYIVSTEKPPKFNCSAATLPFDDNFLADPSAAIGTFAPGDPVTVPVPDLNTCETSSGPLYYCEFTCEVLEISACVGMDCVNGESFDGDNLRLKENNLRIRFHDTSISGVVLGQSWNLEANSVQNGGLSYFAFQVKSVEKDVVVYSDGTAWPLYDCSATESDPFVSPTPVFDQACLDDPQLSGCTDRFNYALIPAGEPIIDSEQTCELVNQQYVCTYTCVERLDHTVKQVFTLGKASSSSPSFKEGVAIGYESAAEDGVISVGRDDLKRRIAKVAKGIAGTDILTNEGLTVDAAALDRESLLIEWIAHADAQLDDIEIEIALLETGPPADPNDIDGDGIANDFDNCISTPNPDQLDSDNDIIGNACDEGDADGDGFSDREETMCSSDPADITSHCSAVLPWLMLLLD